MAKRAYGTGRIVPTANRNRWRIKYRIGRREKTETITGSRRDAEALLRQRLVERDQGGGWPSEEPLGKTIEAWLRHKTPLLRENTLSNYRCLLGHVLAHPIAHTPLAKVSPQALADLFSELPASGRGLRTSQAVYTRLGSVFAWAVKKRSITVNPLVPIERPKAPKPKPRAIEHDVLDRILAAAASDPLTDCFANLALDTGLRRGELFGLQWGDLKGNELAIRRAATVVRGKLSVGELKSETAYRTLGLPASTVAALERYRRSLAAVPHPKSFFFPGANGLPRHPDRFRRQVWVPLLRRAGVNPQRLHELRHTHATMLLEEGADWALVGSRLGHASPTQTFNTYAHVRRGRDQKAIELIDRARGRA